MNTAHAPALDIPARFFALSLASWLALAVLAPRAAPLLLGSFYAPALLAYVHLNTLGVVAAVLMGASYQLVPVVTQTRLAAPAAARGSFWALLGGMSALLAGLSGRGAAWTAAGGSLLLLAFTLYLGVLAATLRRAPARDVVTAHVAAAGILLLLGVGLGATLALHRAFGFLGGATFRLLAAHAVLMLGGWVGVMLMGVSYRLVAMFTLTQDRLRPALTWGGLLLTVAGVLEAAAGILSDATVGAGLAGALLLALGLTVWSVQLALMYLGSRRTGDVHVPFAVFAALSAVAAVALLAWGWARGAGLGAPCFVAAVWLAVAGTAQTAICGFFYKIATFLVWLQRYAPRAGRERVPRLEEMYSRPLAFAGLAAWMGGVVAIALAVGASSPALAAAGGILQAVAVAAFLANVVRIASHLVRKPPAYPLQEPVGRVGTATNYLGKPVTDPRSRSRGNG